MRAYVLIKISEAGKRTTVQASLLEAGVNQVDQVAGIYDLVAVLEGNDPRQIGELVIGTIQPTDGVVETITHLVIG